MRIQPICYATVVPLTTQYFPQILHTVRIYKALVYSTRHFQHSMGFSDFANIREASRLSLKRPRFTALTLPSSFGVPSACILRGIRSSTGAVSYRNTLFLSLASSPLHLMFEGLLFYYNDRTHTPLKSCSVCSTVEVLQHFPPFIFLFFLWTNAN